MKRRKAVLASIILTILVAMTVFLLNPLEQRKTVYISEVIDGDTFKSDDISFRLVNVNTPEKSEKGYGEAKQFLAQFAEATVEIEEISTDRYGRTLVRVYTPDYINLELVKRGLATKFLVQNSELRTFDQAENSAVEKSLGRWKKSDLFGCIETTLDQKEEILSIESSCGAINFKDFIVADESRKRYKFPDAVLHNSKIIPYQSTVSYQPPFFLQHTF